MSIKKYAFIYIGQLRTWDEAIPKWHNLFKRVKPDVYLFVHEPKEKQYELSKYQEVFGPDVNIVHLYYWTEEEINQYISTRKQIKGRIQWTCQFWQLKRIFTTMDFRKYDVVAKFRFDVIPLEGKDLNMDSAWDKIEEVAPHIAELQKLDNPKEEYGGDGRVNSYLKYRDCITLGGAYVINKEEEYQNIDINRVVWMINDLVIWSTAENMHKLMETYYDKYETYDYGNKNDWYPEAQIVYHCKNIGLQPLMTTSGIVHVNEPI